MSSKPAPQLRRPVLGELKHHRPVSAGFVYQSCHGRLTIPGVCTDSVFTANDLADEGEIGRGAFGFVNRMLHIPTGSVMAVKRMRSTLNESEQTKTLKDLDVVMHSSNCPFIVRFYGALFEEGDCWICMEMMATSLDKFYKFVYRYLLSRIPEGILAKIAVATIAALDYLKVELKVIHRDVKPSNILIDRKGNIKLCDFGISGELVDSIAKSHDVGCKPYMAPERIHPNLSANGYDIRSDVWSFGITMVELATGQFPYPAWNSVFEQLTCVLNGDPPCLPERLPSFSRLHLSGSTTTVSEVDTKMESGGLDDDSDFSSEFRDFVSQCLQKDVRSRPKYHTLMNHAFYQRGLSEKVDVGAYFCTTLDKVPLDLNLNEFVSQPS
ncbi:Dual specificity mitogen-activated protein kinase kinase 4 [Clonorchis sinensis]|uniref:mitogen-activated protein kinase kinase n=1 Tax=Clonorchis sinensis TaxID=79923 RepID=A0A8T1MUV8_CLOSI|nr:Dual specificity mitogen-activated protein kinase kinase 4 [Clonorchis sinensis]